MYKLSGASKRCKLFRLKCLKKNLIMIFFFFFHRFDSETQNLMDDLRQEKASRERLAREKEIAIAEKFTIEQNLSVSS